MLPRPREVTSMFGQHVQDIAPRGQYGRPGGGSWMVQAKRTLVVRKSAHLVLRVTALGTLQFRLILALGDPFRLLCLLVGRIRRYRVFVASAAFA